MISFAKKKFLIWIGLGLVGLFLLGFAFFYFSTEKKLKLIFPNGGEELRAGKTYQIKWKSNKVGRIGIILIDENTKERKILVEDFPASKQKYDWQIFVWEKPETNYKISIFEYPWQEKNLIDYSDDRFTILGPSFASCDILSIEAEWPFIPSDFPNLKRVFITSKKWKGNLEGLEGADKKCQEEAEALGLKGNFKAFLGDDDTLAVERLNLDGIFVEATGGKVLPQINIPPYLWKSFKEFLEKSPFSPKDKQIIISAHNTLEGSFQKFLENWYAKEDEKTCYRLLGKNFNDFFQKLSDSMLLNQKRFNNNFLENLSKIWLGRINNDSKLDCIYISNNFFSYDVNQNYSFTTTCQNWKVSERLISEYLLSKEEKEKVNFPICYTSQGQRINAVGLAGLASDFIVEGKDKFLNPYLGISCDTERKLLCIEQ